MPGLARQTSSEGRTTMAARILAIVMAAVTASVQVPSTPAQAGSQEVLDAGTKQDGTGQDRTGRLSGRTTIIQHPESRQSALPADLALYHHKHPRIHAPMPAIAHHSDKHGPRIVFPRRVQRSQTVTPPRPLHCRQLKLLGSCRGLWIACTSPVASSPIVDSPFLASRQG